MKEKKYGFTLIELLAVIIILGVLMVIAIPSVTNYIQTSRKNAYAVTAKELIKGVSNEVNSGELEYYDPDVTYYYPGSCVTTESGGNSPFGDWRDYYVVYTYNGNGFDYYWASVDTANMGVYLTYSELIDGESVIPDVKEINPNIGVGSRSKVSVIDNGDCRSIASTIEADETIEEHGKYDGSSSETPTNVSTVDCFEFDKSTGTITSYLCGVENVEYSVSNVDKCADYFMNYEFLGFTNIDEAKNYCETNIIDHIESDWFWDDELADMIDKGFLKETVVSPAQLNVVIPSKIDGVQVKVIGAFAFENFGLTSVVIPEGIEVIEYASFGGNNLKSITFPKSLIIIEDDSFSGNYISKIIIPENVEEIGWGAFENAGMLYEIVNKTGRAFDWSSIVFDDYDIFEPFVTGVVESRYPFNTKVNITSSDSINIPVDSMFEYRNDKSLYLKDRKGYRVYYSNDGNNYVEMTSPGVINYSSRDGCSSHYIIKITDSSNNLLYSSPVAFFCSDRFCNCPN